MIKIARNKNNNMTSNTITNNTTPNITTNTTTSNGTSDIIFHSDVSCNLGCSMDMLNGISNNNSNNNNNTDNDLHTFRPDIVSFSTYKFGGPHYGIVLSNTNNSNTSSSNSTNTNGLRGKYSGTPDVKCIYEVCISLEYYLSNYKTTSLQDTQFQSVLKSTLYSSFQTHDVDYIDLSTTNTSSNIVVFIITALKSSLIQKSLSELGYAIGAGSACLSNEGSYTLRSMGYN